MALRIFYRNMKSITNFKSLNKNILFVILWTVVSALAAFIVYFCFSFSVMMGYTNLPCATTKADCIIVPGTTGGTDILYSRCEKAAEIFKGGYSGYIIVSGCYDENICKTEAQSACDMLTGLGVPKDSIILETKAANTWENFIFVKEIMEKNGFSSSILVSNDFHLLRCISVARKLGYFDMTVVSMPTDKEFLWYLRLRECRGIMFYALSQRF